MAETPKTKGIGAPLPRNEDQRLLTGQGRFGDDINWENQLYAAILRSPHAHALINGVNTSAASNMPGVHAVLSAKDIEADGINPIHHPPPRNGPPDIVLDHRGDDPKFLPQPLLADGRVRFVGEAVVMVIADTVMQARDAAEAIQVDYTPLTQVTEGLDAAQPDAPKIWDGVMATNLFVDADSGDRDATDIAFEQAAHVVRLETKIRRVTGVPMEPRTALGSWDSKTGDYALHAGCGGVVRLKRELIKILNATPEKVRVTAWDIGGNFGTRNAIYPEFPLVMWAAKRVGRPVKWTATRSESFLSDHQGRDLASESELALDRDGKFLGLRGRNTLNGGAYPITVTPLVKGVELMTGVYAIPTAHFHARATVSNKPPVNNYRSSGRPEAMYIIERLIDLAAHKTGIDPVELRRKNMIPIIGEGYVNALGLAYDSGDFPKVMDSACSLADRSGFAARRAKARKRGRYRGMGVANYLELTGGYPTERTEITVHAKGVVDVVIGTLSSGQGHETSFAQLITEWMGVPIEQVNLITGDTDRVIEGGGSHSARSMRLAGIVIGKATDAILERGRMIVAHLFDAELDRIDFTDDRFVMDGTNRSLDIFEVAAAAENNDTLPDDLRGPLGANYEETVREGAFPYGCHVCEVEVDPETGHVEIVHYAAVDDVGRAINPLILHGQTHGGAVQGIGQAMGEHCILNADDGQVLTGSFLDYPMPRAHTSPPFTVELSEVPSPRNKLGVRGGGEGGTTPALGVMVNAVVDALSDLGVEHIEMPLTAHAVWRAIQDAKTN